jgi:hypothetical protein
VRILGKVVAATIVLLAPVVRADDTPPGTSETAVKPAGENQSSNQPTVADSPVPPQIPFAYTFHGFIRGGYTWLPYNPNVSQLIGHDSGFRLYNTRLEFSGAFSKWVDFDISVDSLSTIDPTTGLAPVQVGFEDAYTTLHYEAAYLRIGQFKTPFNGEFLLDDQNIPFVRRSAVTEGLAVDESNTPEPGILLDRQIGAMLGGRVQLTGPVGLNLSLAAVNGSGPDQARNDNPYVAVVGRISIGTDRVFGAISGYWNDVTTGTLSTRTTDRVFAGDADILINTSPFKAGAGMGALRIFGMFTYKHTSFLTVPANEPISSIGAVFSFGVPIELDSVVVEPAVRYVFFEPDSTLTAPTGSDSTATTAFQMQDATIGLNLSPRALRLLRLQINYTQRFAASVWEQPGQIVETVVQANF